MYRDSPFTALLVPRRLPPIQRARLCSQEHQTTSPLLRFAAACMVLLDNLSLSPTVSKQSRSGGPPCCESRCPWHESGRAVWSIPSTREEHSSEQEGPHAACLHRSARGPHNQHCAAVCAMDEQARAGGEQLYLWRFPDVTCKGNFGSRESARKEFRRGGLQGDGGSPIGENCLRGAFEKSISVPR